jgi:hypothetical protein
LIYFDAEEKLKSTASWMHQQSNAFLIIRFVDY